MQLLLIEDNPLVRDAMIRILERGGFTVVSVANGLAGLAELRDRRFAAIVCDLRLPFLEGQDFFAQVQDLFPDMSKRMVFVTGWADDQKINSFLKETGQPYLGKPFAAQDLLDAVQGVAGKV